MNLHFYYDQLDDPEKDFADEIMREAFKFGEVIGHPLRGDDSAERAVDGLARWILESREAVESV